MFTKSKMELEKSDKKGRRRFTMMWMERVA